MVFRRPDLNHISRFNKHVNSKKEWFVITDPNMNVISAQEGQLGKINRITRNRGYSEAIRVLPSGHRDIFAFHSHPKRYGIANPSPSKQDVERLGGMEDGVYKRGLNIRAEGVMTTHGIKVMRLEHDENAQDIPGYYDKQLTVRLKEEAKARGLTKENFRFKSDREKRRLFIAGHGQAFFDTQKEYPELKTEFIRRDRLSRSDVRPHSVTYTQSPPRSSSEFNDDAHQMRELIGDFGKRKKHNMTKFYGV